MKFDFANVIKPKPKISKVVPPTAGKPNPVANQNVQSKVSRGITSLQDLLAPAAIEVDFDHLKIGNKFYRTLFVTGYPRYVTANWLSPLVNYDNSLQVSMFIYPIEGKGVLDDLRRKIAEMEAEINLDAGRGVVINPLPGRN